MKKSLISIKVSAQEKRAAQKLAKEFGFSLSSVMKAYLKDFLRNRRIEVGLEERELELTDWAKQELKKSGEDIKAGRVISFNSYEEEMDYLDSLIRDAEKRVSENKEKA